MLLEPDPLFLMNSIWMSREVGRRLLEPELLIPMNLVSLS
jgi:hypothetical protein